jgi:multiple sugar transport system permease protein
VLLLVAVLGILPLVWMVSASLRPPDLPPPRVIEWLPDPLAPQNYLRIFEMLPFGRYLTNSALVVLVAVPLTLATASMAGFAMAQLTHDLRRSFVFLSVLLLMVPITALWLTRFLVLRTLGLTDSLAALILPAIMGTSPLFVLLFFWSFRRLPGELFESARLEGIGAFGAWWRIGLPLVVPTTVAVGVLAFLSYWSDFISPLLYLRSQELFTLTLGLRQLQQLDRSDWSLLMAGAVLLTVPTVAVFAIAQRWFLSGDRLGSVADR